MKEKGYSLTIRFDTHKNLAHQILDKVIASPSPHETTKLNTRYGYALHTRGHLPASTLAVASKCKTRTEAGTERQSSPHAEGFSCHLIEKRRDGEMR